MIRILLSETGLTPDISILNTSEEVVSTGEMTELDPSNDGRFWYGYSYDGVPGNEYRVIIDAGSAIQESELRYFDFWVTESMEDKILLLERMQRATMRISGTQIILEDEIGEIQRWNLIDVNGQPTSSVPYKREKVG